MHTPMTQESLNQLFFEARTFNHWVDRPVDEALLERLHDLVKMGPTSANCLPGRFLFVKSREAKERLKPCLAEGNVEQTMSAPVTVIVGNDHRFYERLPELFPHTDAKSWFEGNDEKIAETAMRNASLQGGYLILAARALGLDCGPMSGFDNAKVDETFFADSAIKSNFLCNLGYGDRTRLHERSPRPSFDDDCQLL